MTPTSRVRVRFAPSPTGHLHVGGARTALFNWLFAKNRGGSFILRIEDTDQERSTAESEEGLLRDLKWLGLDWDEGPGVGGPHGPYRQSERTAIYQEYAQRLVKSGAAYHCFCSEELLEQKRKQAEAEHRSHHYDGTCRNLSPDDVQARLARGEKGAIRVRVPQKDCRIEDLVRGTVEWMGDTLGDFIILRSNGMPVYNFCVVVDDSQMEITHVIRAEEHLPNTHRQMILYEALGIKPPVFAHASLILGPDKTKLSKRHGATSVNQYAEDGFLPEAMVNFLALLGWNEGIDKEIYSKNELIEKFSLERISKSPAVFDHAKLNWTNGMHIRGLGPVKLAEILDPVLRETFHGNPLLATETGRLKAANLLLNALTVIKDAPSILKPIIEGGQPENDEARAFVADPKAASLWQAVREELTGADWQRVPLNDALKRAGKKVGMTGKNLFMPVRVKLTGSCHGPDLLGILDFLGREEVLRRFSS